MNWRKFLVVFGFVLFCQVTIIGAGLVAHFYFSTNGIVVGVFAFIVLWIAVIAAHLMAGN